MIKSVHEYTISQLFETESSIIYTIPRYQREYQWSTQHWEKLFDDVVENDSGYFIGSIICINQSTDSLAVQNLEVVDGQQRLTTISLFFAALYSYLLKIDSELDEEQKFEILNIKRKLTLKKGVNQLRIIPQIQNHNLEDYRFIMSDIKLIGHHNRPAFLGNRKIQKAYKYYQTRIEDYINDSQDKNKTLFNLLDKINQAMVVKIEVFSHSEAYILFESLNNRGMPLTAVDLIKNDLLARLEMKESGKIDDYFEQWMQLLNFLTDDYNVQERFFRQYYNAFKENLNSAFKGDSRKKDPLGNLATRTNLIQIYQELIKKDPHKFLNDILDAGKLYSIIIGNNEDDEYKSLKKSL